MTVHTADNHNNDNANDNNNNAGLLPKFRLKNNKTKSD